jgi:peptidoglycan/LPS O-acetylase OafA/YrhL
VVKSLTHVGGLDLIRFVAASLVLTFHLAFFSWASSVGLNYELVGAPKYPELAFTNAGWVGVEIFFVLSGFVIAQSAEGSSALRFLRGRVGRLMPAIWICSSLTLVVLLWLGGTDIHKGAPDYFRTLIIYPSGPWIDGVYWTLTLEVFFYGAIFLLLVFDLFNYIEMFAIVLGGFSSVYLVCVAFFGAKQVSLHLLAQHGCFFSLGIFIWLCQSRGITAFRVLFSAILIVAGLTEICFVAHGRLVDSSFWSAPLIWLLCLIGIVVSVVVGRPGNEITRKLGLMTYPLYLLHFSVGSAVLRVNIWTGRYVALFLAISVTLALSWIVVELERPIRVRVEAALDWIVGRFILVT